MRSWVEKSPLEIGVPLSIAHEMRRTRTLEHGVEEWSCTECSRRLLFRRPPAFEKVVLDRGDERATHVGGSSGLHSGCGGCGTPAERRICAHPTATG